VVIAFNARSGPVPLLLGWAWEHRGFGSAAVASS